jgi:hypothetical protein
VNRRIKEFMSLGMAYYAPLNTPPSSLGISSTAKDWNTGEMVTKSVTTYETKSSVNVLKK